MARRSWSSLALGGLTSLVIELSTCTVISTLPWELWERSGGSAFEFRSLLGVSCSLCSSECQADVLVFHVCGAAATTDVCCSLASADIIELSVPV